MFVVFIRAEGVNGELWLTSLVYGSCGLRGLSRPANRTRVSDSQQTGLGSRGSVGPSSEPIGENLGDVVWYCLWIVGVFMVYYWLKIVN